MKSYIIVMSIKDGEYEYFSKFRHELDPEKLNLDIEERDKFILENVNGEEYERTWCGTSFESVGSSDCRYYSIYSVREISPEHLDVLSLYGVI